MAKFQTADGRTYPKPEPRLWDSRLAILAAAMVLIAVALTIREAKAFGIVAGLDSANTALAFRYIEAMAMALGVALSAIMTLLYWRPQETMLSWETAGLIIAGTLEAINSYLSATVATGELAWFLGNREITLIILSVGGVFVWLVDGKILSSVFSAYKNRHDAWDEAGQIWLNRELAKAQRKAAKRTATESPGNAEKGLGTALETHGIAKRTAATTLTSPAMQSAMPSAIPELPVLPNATLQHFEALQTVFPTARFTVNEAASALPIAARQCRNVLEQLHAAGFLRKEGRRYKIVFGAED